MAETSPNIQEALIERVARAICAERNAGDCRLGCTKDTGCLTTGFDENDAEYHYARAALSTSEEEAGRLNGDVERRLLSVATTLETCGKHGIPIDFAMLAHDIREALRVTGVGR